MPAPMPVGDRAGACGQSVDPASYESTHVAPRTLLTRPIRRRRRSESSPGVLRCRTRPVNTAEIDAIHSDAAPAPGTQMEGLVNELTFKARLKDRDRQRFFVTYLAGKMAGLI